MRAALTGRVDRVQRRMTGKDAAVAEFLALPADVAAAWMMGEATDEQRARYPLAWKQHTTMWRELLRRHDDE
jgi:hypothetical protein